MGQRRKPGVAREGGDEREIRDQEVLRAKRELAAYFKGRRTEREARAALKIIKAFVRERERLDAKSRPPLPGTGAVKTSKEVTSREATRDSDGRPRETPRGHTRDKFKHVTASTEPASQLGIAAALGIRRTPQ